MDEVLHRERLDGRRSACGARRLASLPEGAFVAIGGRAHALSDGALRPWSFAGYGAAAAFDRGLEVDVLTPRSTVAALASGYRPVWRGAEPRA